MNKTIIFRQFFCRQSCTYTYVIADQATKEAAVIDAVDTCFDRDLMTVNELGLNLTHVIETHIHADHITGAAKLAQKTGAKYVLGSASGVDCADILLADGEQLKIGNLTLTALHTPGHTAGCCSYKVADMVFTGDTLLIHGCGRTDFQDGDASKLYDSVKQKLFTLPGSTKVYPAHDYNGRTTSTIGEEKQFNPRLGNDVSKERFIDIMNNLNLADPLKINIAVPANTNCGYSV